MKKMTIKAKPIKAFITRQIVKTDQIKGGADAIIIEDIDVG